MEPRGLALLVPEVFPEETARDAANNLLRLRALEETYRELAGLPVEFAALKINGSAKLREPLLIMR